MAKRQAVQSLEGMVVGIPLPRRGGFGIIVLARVERGKSRVKIVLAYGYGPRLPKVPTDASGMSMSPDTTALIARASDLFIAEQRWNIIGMLPGFERNRWPLVPFKRWDRLIKSFVKTTCDEASLKSLPGPGVEISDREAARLPWDGLHGSGALEYALDDAIDAQQNGSLYVPVGPDRPPPARLLRNE